MSLFIINFTTKIASSTDLRHQDLFITAPLFAILLHLAVSMSEYQWVLVVTVPSRVLGKADPGTFFQCKNIEEGNAIIEDGKRQVFFFSI